MDGSIVRNFFGWRRMLRPFMPRFDAELAALYMVPCHSLDDIVNRDGVARRLALKRAQRALTPIVAEVAA